MVIGAVFGVPALLLLIYMTAAIMNDNYEFGWGTAGRMSRNVNSVVLQAPFEIAVWIIFHLYLVLFMGAAALRPYWISKRKNLVPALLVLGFLSIVVNIIIYRLR
jgi:hypothetical protein